LNAVLKYYKLLFTLPKGRKLYATAIVVTSLLFLRMPLVALSLAIFSLLFYEERALNGRRLSALAIASSTAALLGKPALAALFLSVAAAIYKPNVLIVLAAPNLMYVTDPASIVAVAPVVLALAYGKRKGTADFGIAWLRAWMGDDYYPLEKFVHDNGARREALIVKAGPLMFTDVHFGLMRYSMGSILPHLSAIAGLVPHRLCGSHENNPASRWDAYSVLSDLPSGEEDRIELSLGLGEGVRAYVYEFTKGCVAIVEHPEGADDLPCVKWKCVVADPHNSEGASPSPEQLLKELSTIKILKKLKLDIPRILELKVEGEGLCESLGLLVDWGNFKHAVVFGNNAVKDKGRLEGVDLVSTVDDHSCAGFGRKTYEPCSLKGYKVLRAREGDLSTAVVRREYTSMGERLLSPEAEEEIIKSIKVGIIMIALALVAALA